MNPDIFFQEWRANTDLDKVEYYATINYFQEIARKEFYSPSFYSGGFSNFWIWLHDLGIFAIPAMTAFLITIGTETFFYEKRIESGLAAIVYLVFISLIYFFKESYLKYLNIYVYISLTIMIGLMLWKHKGWKERSQFLVILILSLIIILFFNWNIFFFSIPAEFGLQTYITFIIGIFTSLFLFFLLTKLVYRFYGRMTN